MPGEDDEPYFEQIGGGLIDDRARRTPGSGGGRQDSDADSVSFARSAPEGSGSEGGPGSDRPASDAGPVSDRPASDAGPDVLGDLRRHAGALRSLPTWLGIAAGLAVPAALTFGLSAWAAAERWIERDLPVAAHLLLGALLVVSASVYGTVVGFRGLGASGGRLAEAAWGSAVRAGAFAVAAGLLLAVVGIAGGGSFTTTTIGVFVMVLELLVFAAVGAGTAALAGTRVSGAILGVALAALLLVGNIAGTILLVPTIWTSERASLAVNVDRDEAGRLIYYECVGNVSRVVAVAHTDRLAWIAASHPAVLFGSLAAGTVPDGTEFGWMLEIPQWALDGPAWEEACLNGMGSEEVPPPLHVGLVGIAAQLGVAALVVVPGRWLSRRRRERGEAQRTR